MTAPNDTDLHAWEIPGTSPPIRLMAGFPEGRKRPALWLDGSIGPVMLASFYSRATYLAFVRGLDACFLAINRTIQVNATEKKTG